jgi:hypothetical protein
LVKKKKIEGSGGLRKNGGDNAATRWRRGRREKRGLGKPAPKGEKTLCTTSSYVFLSIESNSRRGRRVVFGFHFSF